VKKFTLRNVWALVTAALFAGGGSSDAYAGSLSFESFVAELWSEAARPPYSISRPVFSEAFRGIVPDLQLPDLDVPGRSPPRTSGQAEFMRLPEEYLSRPQLAGLAETGRRLARLHSAALTEIERRFGVDRTILLAIWGRETAYGTHKLKHDAIRVLATLAWTGRRKDLFRTELLYALKMLEDGIVTRSEMRSSWAGAMGLTQLMPSEFYSSLQDLDGGKADVFNSAPDALASAARQLQQKGWIAGLPWGFEVRLPDNLDCSFEGPTQSRKLQQWAAQGVTRADGSKIVNYLDAEAYLMSPAGSHGPAFLVTENYKVIRRYNMSDLYATFVGHLADRIGGSGDFKVNWSSKAARVAESEIAEIQDHLRQLGAGVEKVDGKIGSNTRMEIGRFQRGSGLAIDCWPSKALLSELRSRARKAATR
jgi:lytic murein transglycosylase